MCTAVHLCVCTFQTIDATHMLWKPVIQVMSVCDFEAAHLAIIIILSCFYICEKSNAYKWFTFAVHSDGKHITNFININIVVYSDYGGSHSPYCDSICH